MGSSPQSGINAIAGALGSLELLHGKTQADRFAGFDHLGANLNFLPVVSHHNSNSLEIGLYPVIGANM